MNFERDDNDDGAGGEDNESGFISALSPQILFSQVLLLKCLASTKIV